MSDITFLWSQITIFIIEITKNANLKVNDPLNGQQPNFQEWFRLPLLSPQ